MSGTETVETKEVLPAVKREGPPPSGMVPPPRMIQSNEACHAGANAGQTSGPDGSEESESY